MSPWPSIAQLVEQWTVVVVEIHLSLVRFRLEGPFFCFLFPFFSLHYNLIVITIVGCMFVPLGIFSLLYIFFLSLMPLAMHITLIVERSIHYYYHAVFHREKFKLTKITQVFYYEIISLLCYSVYYWFYTLPTDYSSVLVTKSEINFVMQVTCLKYL